ncbi:MAG: CocE/NonD family hydrolase [Planctomycetes bacterium]|nr:CocE/NonD family hydrolase [Planctomycetota bacterium]
MDERRSASTWWFARATAAVAVSLVAPLAAQDRPIEEVYERFTAMVPMRDGVRLYTECYVPREIDEPLGIVFLRTPYGVAAGGDRFTRYFASTFRELAKDRYAFAVQDARGRHGSEGIFVWNRPLRDRRDPDAIDESSDAWDSIDWLTANVPGCNGRVGMLGVSYPGWLVTMALVDPHPALRCASPQASPSDYFVNDDFFHNGAFRLSPSAELPYLFDFDPKANARFPYDQVDCYEFFLDLGPLSNLDARYLHGASPTWSAFLEHSTYDEFWRTGNTLQHLTKVTVPTLNVFGWWDAENLGGAHDIYTTLEPYDVHGLNRIVVGPWAHGQWADAGAVALGDYEFGSDTSAYYQREIEAPWFAHHLMGRPDPGLPEALMFQTGTDDWKRYDAWPPTGLTTAVELFLRADGSLSFEPLPDGAAGGSVSWLSDPNRPVPYTKRPIMGFWSGLRGSREPRFGRAGKLWKVEDQRFVADRPDVMVFQTPPLDRDVEVTGRIVVDLFASTTGTDADWIVKLIDVYPERYEPKPELGGFQLMIADDVVRAKFRAGLADPRPVEPGAIEDYAIDLRTRNHLFRRGHRIMLQVQSTWFPLIDRNPQTFVDIPRATAADYRRAEHTVHCSPQHPSRIRLDVVR